MGTCGTFTAGGVRPDGAAGCLVRARRAGAAPSLTRFALDGAPTSASRVPSSYASTLTQLSYTNIPSMKRLSARNFCTYTKLTLNLNYLPSPSLTRVMCTAADGDAPTLTHLDAQGRARMVDVGGKAMSFRSAEAECYVRMSARLLRLLRDARLPKGDALTVAQVAGALGAKRTAELIPLCHSLPLEVARVRVRLPRGECAHGGAARVSCEVRTTAKTGVEMEALTGAALAALTLYDMCKSVDRHMTVTELRVVRKTGGSHDFDSTQTPKADPEAQHVRAHDTSPIKHDETYVPTNLSHF